MDDPKIAIIAGLTLVALFVLVVVLGGRSGTVSVPDPEDAGALEALRSAVGALPGIGGGRPLEPRDLTGLAGCEVEARRVMFGTCSVQTPDDVSRIDIVWVEGQARIVLVQEEMVDQRVDLPGDLEEPKTPEGRHRSLVVRDGRALFSLACVSVDLCVVEIGEPQTEAVGG